MCKNLSEECCYDTVDMFFCLLSIRVMIVWCVSGITDFLCNECQWLAYIWFY